MGGSTRFFNTSSTFSVHPDLAQGPWEACPSFEDLSSLAVPPFCLPGSSGQNSVLMCAYTPSHLDMSSGQVLPILYFVLSSYLTASSGQISDPASPSSCAALASPVWHFILCHRGPVPSWSSCHPGWSWSPGHPPVSSRSLVELASFFEPWTGYLRLFASPALAVCLLYRPGIPSPAHCFLSWGPVPLRSSSFLLFALGVGRSFSSSGQDFLGSLFSLHTLSAGTVAFFLRARVCFLAWCFQRAFLVTTPFFLSFPRGSEFWSTL